VTLSTNTPEGCVNMCSEFQADTVPPGSTYLWNFGDGGTSTDPSPTHCYTGPGNFTATLQIVTSDGCVYNYTLPSAVVVHPNPIADFALGPQPTTILEPEICFSDLSSNDVVSWYWNFGDPNDQTTASTENTCHTYSDTGNYCVNLVVTNQYGCFSTTEYCLEIQPYYGIYVPNAFTPNNDGKNDVFLPSMYNIQDDSYQLEIFDRWGNLIFATNDVYQGWD
jgi:PKD repeat protein